MTRPRGQKPRIGFIGTGIMGKPMAGNLLRAGYEVAVYNRTAARVADLLAAGASAPGSPRLVAAQSDVLITILPGWPELQTVLEGPEGVLVGIEPGAIYIDMETIAPEQARSVAAAMAACGVQALDAPVSGGERGAIEGSLSIMVGGPDETFDAVLPILSALGRNVARIGESGAGQIAKACNQLIVAVTIEAVAEALALARSLGVDQSRVREVMLGGFASSRILELHGLRMIEGNFVPGGAAKAHLKDRAIIAQAAAAAGFDVPAARVAFDRIKELVDRGGGELDHSALYTLLTPVADRL